MWKADEGETESTILLIFVLWRCFNRRWVMGGGMGWDRNPYSGPAEMGSFSRWDFNQTNENDKYWHVLSAGYFYILFLWAMAVADFCHLGLPLSTITYIQYKICFHIKTYIHIYNYNYNLHSYFIFKFDLNVKHDLYFFK